MNYSTVLNQSTWGAHFNFEGHFSSPPSCPSWLTQLQQQDWQWRGIVVWDADHRTVAHLYAGYALEILEHLQANDDWRSNGFLISSPTYQLSSNGSGTLSTDPLNWADSRTFRNLIDSAPIFAPRTYGSFASCRGECQSLRMPWYAVRMDRSDKTALNLNTS